MENKGVSEYKTGYNMLEKLEILSVTTYIYV